MEQKTKTTSKKDTGLSKAEKSTTAKIDKVESSTKSKATKKDSVAKKTTTPTKTTKKTENKDNKKKKTIQTKTKSNEPKNIKILGFNDLELNTYIYDNVQNPKAVVVVIHGMQEHCLRYKNFAEFLNKNGYITITNDLRGHGHTVSSKEYLGYGEKDIFTESLKDQLNVINFVNENFNLPIYLFGHSYGSMLSQNLLQQTPLIEKCVLCGTTNGSSAIMKMGNMVISMLSPFKKTKSKGGIVEKMCISSYGKKFKNGNWLTRDEKVFEEYLKDEYCGGSFPFSFYKSMIKNMNKANKGIGKIGNKKLFLIAGDKDPVGEEGKQVKKLYKIYLKHNINAKMKLYKDARHELLNEINKEEVYQDIINFYND